MHANVYITQAPIVNTHDILFLRDQKIHLHLKNKQDLKEMNWLKLLKHFIFRKMIEQQLSSDKVIESIFFGNYTLA